VNTYEFESGTLTINEIGGMRRVKVMNIAKGFWCQRTGIMTTYPLDLILFIAEKKGVHLVCEEIRRHEDNGYIKEFFHKEMFSFSPKEEWKKKDRILDFACGAGSSTLILADEFPRLRIHGLDIDPIQIEIATKRAQILGYANVKFELSDDPLYVPDTCYDRIVMSAVVEHLTPKERSIIIPKLYDRLTPGGVIFINQTPNRYYPVETHTTGLPLINYLPDRLAFWYARVFSRRKKCGCSWESMLKMGIRGASVSEIISIVRDKSDSGRDLELLPLSDKPGYHDAIELWREGPQYRNHPFVKRLIYYPTLLMYKVTGKVFLPYIFLAIRKPITKKQSLLTIEIKASYLWRSPIGPPSMKKTSFITKLEDGYRHNRRFEFSYLRTLLFNRHSPEEKKAIEIYKNKHQGQAGVVVATGPSLNDISIEQLKKLVTISVNRIYLLYDRTDFRPTYYCLEDHMVAEDNAAEINSLNGSVMFIPKDLSYCIKGNKNIVYTNFIRRYKGRKRKSMFSTNFAQKAYWGGTVTYYALQLAYYLGFKKVYIVGLDHNYTRPQNSTGEKIISSGSDVNHFDPRYFGKGKRWHAPNNLVDRMEASYRKAKRIFVQSGRQIINVTPNSKLSEDVFPKINFENIPELERK